MIRACSFPLDIAPQTRMLLRTDGLTGDQSVHCCAQITACDGNSAARTAVVELPTIDQLQPFVKEKEIRRASRSVGARHLLSFVVQIREIEPHGVCLLGQT